jgi:hypothetical protein
MEICRSKKKYLKTEDIQELVDYTNTQKSKKKKAKKKKSEPNISMVVLQEGEEEIECKKYKYLEKEYYVNIKNNNVYDMSKRFVGRMVEDVINFDEEEI